MPRRRRLESCDRGMISLSTLLLAIAMVESGDAQHPNGNPAKVGKAGERSEYQITKAVWKKYADKPFNARNTQNANLSHFVAHNHINFIRSDGALYLMSDQSQVELIAAAWNAGHNYITRHRYNLAAMSPSVRDYARRVANTYERLRKEGL